MSTQDGGSTARPNSKRNLIFVGIIVVCAALTVLVVVRGSNPASEDSATASQARQASDELTSKLKASQAEAYKRNPNSKEPEYSGAPGEGRKAIDPPATSR